MAHTPGPWTWQYGEGFFGPKPSPRGKPVPVATIESDGACGDPECCGAPSYSIETRQEDAALIVAAPDLLAALKSCLEQLTAYEEKGWLGDHWRTRIGVREDIAAAQAAIAKAEGAE
jgi:hypothetical protein